MITNFSCEVKQFFAARAFISAATASLPLSHTINIPFAQFL